MLEPTAAIAAAERIRSRVGARVHRLGQPDEITEDAMPRKASTEQKPEPKPEPKKRGRKPGSTNAKKPARAVGPTFGVFDDGSVTLALPDCKGKMNPEEVAAFTGFLKRIGVKV